MAKINASIWLFSVKTCVGAVSPAGMTRTSCALSRSGRLPGGGIAALTTAEEEKKHQGKESKQTHRNLAFQK